MLNSASFTLVSKELSAASLSAFSASNASSLEDLYSSNSNWICASAALAVEASASMLSCSTPSEVSALSFSAASASILAASSAASAAILAASSAASASSAATLFAVISTLILVTAASNSASLLRSLVSMNSTTSLNWFKSTCEPDKITSSLPFSESIAVCNPASASILAASSAPSAAIALTASADKASSLDVLYSERSWAICTSAALAVEASASMLSCSTPSEVSALSFSAASASILAASSAASAAILAASSAASASSAATLFAVISTLILVTAASNSASLLRSLVSMNSTTSLNWFKSTCEPDKITSSLPFSESIAVCNPASAALAVEASAASAVSALSFSAEISAVNPASAAILAASSADKSLMIATSFADKDSRFSTNPGKSLFSIPTGDMIVAPDKFWSDWPIKFIFVFAIIIVFFIIYYLLLCVLSHRHTKDGVSFWF